MLSGAYTLRGGVSASPAVVEAAWRGRNVECPLQFGAAGAGVGARGAARAEQARVKRCCTRMRREAELAATAATAQRTPEGDAAPRCLASAITS